jgi:hypothetical protein
MGQRSSQSSLSSAGSALHVPETQECTSTIVGGRASGASMATVRTRSPPPFPVTQPPPTRPADAACAPTSPTSQSLATQPFHAQVENRPTMTMPEEEEKEEEEEEASTSSSHCRDPDRDDDRWGPEEEDEEGYATSQPPTQLVTQPVTQHMTPPCVTSDGVEIDSSAEATGDETSHCPNPEDSRLDRAENDNDDDDDDDLVARDGSNATETASIAGDSRSFSVVLGFRTGRSGGAIAASYEQISKAENNIGTTDRQDAGAKVDIDDVSDGEQGRVESVREMNTDGAVETGHRRRHCRDVTHDSTVAVGGEHDSLHIEARIIQQNYALDASRSEVLREDALARADVNDASDSDGDSQRANDAQGLRGFTQHNHPMTAMVPPPAMTDTGGEAVDASEVGQIVNPHLQFVDAGRGDDTTGVNTIDKHNNDESATSTTPHHRTNTVTNPYARNSGAALVKRPFDQIIRGSSPSDTSHANPYNFPHKNISITTSVSASVTRNQLSNSYYKSNQTTKRTEEYSYSKKKASGPDIIHLPADTANNSYHEPLPAATYSSGKLPSFRPAGISISLPMAERLPSRNVSYRPAEILTVGELYRYMYHTNGTEEHQFVTQKGLESESEGRTSEDAGSEPAPRKELASVRITGTLLCVANSNPDEMDGVRRNLYSSGVFFLVGDPLENTRFLKRDFQTMQQGEHNTADAHTGDAAIATKSKAGLTSILRNKSAPTPRSSADMSKSPGATPTKALKCDDPTATVNEKQLALVAEGRGSADNDTITKPMSRGILNTNKKKKMVFNGGGSRLSFGGVGSGAGRGEGNLGGRKFITPKRVNSSVPVPGVMNQLTKRACLSSVAKRGASSSVDSTKLPNLEQVIDRHPSPIVPVWVGPSYDNDGLDSSVVGDLVMIMGEIVTEYCDDCHRSNSADGGTDCMGMANDENLGASSLDSENQHAEAEENSHVMHSHELYITTTSLRGVRDAAKHIAHTALKISGGASKCWCQRFLKARLVKNANGTDMSLQRESLRARRAYLAERKRQMEYLVPDHNTTNEGLYSVGLGLPG